MRVDVDLNNPDLNGTPAATLAAANSQNACPATGTPDLPAPDITCRILHPIEVPFISKPIGDKKRYNNSLMVRARARPQL